MKKLLPLISLFFALNVFSQKEANFWYFGNNAALDFNSGVPVPATGSQLNTTEGCSSFSDTDGNLLFYIGAPSPTTNNLTVWDRNNQPMPNGINLEGDASSSQSALTVPAPGQPNIFYIFTVGAPSSGNQGFWYYTLDMSANGGLGDIVAGPVDLSEGSSNLWSEKVTAVRSDVCGEFWVISFRRPNIFYAYKVDNTGVDTARPIISTINGYSVNQNGARGYLKVSPDGEKLVSANMGDGTFLFDFNDATGEVTNFNGTTAPNQINLSGEDGYGVEFSISSRRLYISTGAFNASTEFLYQFDVTQSNINDINNSRYQVHTYFNTRGALQLGPDAKVYWASDGSSNISVINNPDELGVASNYEHQRISVGTGVTSSQGLPPFISSLLLPIEITDSSTGQPVNNQNLQLCTGTDKTIIPETITGVTPPTYEWTFDDGTTSTVIANTPNISLSNLALTDTGTYTLEVELTDSCGNVTQYNGTFNITVFDAATATQPTNIVYCDTDRDGFNNFDLQTDKTPEILNGLDPAMFEVVYYGSMADATANNIPLAFANPYTNATAFGTETVYARVHNRNATNACFDITTFTLQVTDLPVATTPLDYEVCDNTTVGTSVDGFVNDFILNTKDGEILGSLDSTQFSVSYHTSLTGAQTDATTDVIDKTVNYTNTTANTQPIFVRVENNANTSCIDATKTFNLRVYAFPTATQPVDINYCDTDRDGFHTFDLQADKNTEILNGQDPTVFEVLYFDSMANATANTGALINPFPNPSAFSSQTIYARVHNRGNTSCFAITDFNLQVTDQPVASDPTVYRFCDNTSVGSDTDGVINDFILNTKDAEILGTLSATQFSVSYHTSLTGAQTSATTDVIDKTTNYTNSVANLQTIYVRVENVDNTACFDATKTFDLIVDPLPVISNTVELKQCDNDTDGFSDFNLYEAATDISTNHLNETFTFYPTQADAIANSNAMTPAEAQAFENRVVLNDIVWARATSNFGCYRISEVTLTVSTTGVPATFSRSFVQCDDFLDIDGNDTVNNDDTDGVASFDFSSVTAEVLALFPPQPLTITYYRNEADALAEINAITDPSNYRNIGYPNSQSIYIRVDSNVDNDCLGFGPYITLTVDAVPVANTVGNLEECDDLADGNGTNGIAPFNLEDQTATILGAQNPANYTVTYHALESEALSGANPLTSPYRNTTPNQQTIYVRVTNVAGCYTNHTSFDLIVNPLPVANFVDDLEVCDDDSDGSARNGFSQTIDLESQTATILGGQDPTNFTVTYHKSLALAQAGTNPLPSPFSNEFAFRETIYVRVYNSTTMCANGISNFDVIVNPEPTRFPVNNLSYCDDDTDGDDTNGIIQSIDLDSQIEALLGTDATDPTTQQPADFNVSFHSTQAAASSGANPLTSPYTNTNTTETIFVRIENKATMCVNDDASFQVIVNPLPDFRVTTPDIVCLNILPKFLMVNSPLGEYDYEWKDPNGNVISSTDTAEVQVSTSGEVLGGNYTVRATTTNGTMCSRERTIVVNKSNIASITEEDVTIIDEGSTISTNDNLSIQIDNTNNNLGIGDYQYALEDENGILIRNYQDAPLFENLEGGIYNILVNDKNGCGTASLLVSVLQFPKFFTPNFDGRNDTWAVKGANTTFYPESSIRIFNRYGKLLVEVPLDSQGWDGNYNSQKLPSDDYWFNITLVPPATSSRKTINKIGHLSLLRK